MTRNVSPRRRQSHSLRLETLEDRRLLAFAAFESTLLRDDNGVPGEIIADNTLAPGETFFLQITAQEFDPGRFGLQAIGIDVGWDASLLDVVEEDFDLPTVVTENLPINQQGTLDQDGGFVRNLGGASNRILQAGRPIGNAIPETLATIRMQAGEQVGTAELNLQFGEEKIITTPYALLGPRHLDLDSEQIRIVAEQSAESDTADPSEPSAEAMEPEASDTNAAEESVEMTTEARSDSGEDQPESLPPVSEPALESSSEIENVEASNEATELIDSEPTVEPEIAETVIPQVVTESEVVVESEAIVEASRIDESVPDTTPVSEASSNSAVVDDSVDDTVNVATVDREMSFDVNQDGVFDFADFGLMNVQASMAASVFELSQTDSTDEVMEAHEETPQDTTRESLVFPKTCLAFPESNDIAANEAWLDAFAAAWIADNEERSRRRREALNS